MLKITRCVLYSLAILAGVAGLFDGGTPLVKYMLQQWRDQEYRSYYDTSYLNSPKIIFLLSLILLIGVRVCFALDKGVRPVKPLDTVSSGKKLAVPASASEISPPSGTAETPAQPAESADEKLTRLLNQKKE